jgi:hypothetical protein
MKSKTSIPDKLLIVDGEKIEGILRRAVRAAPMSHKSAGNTIAIWENDRVVLVPAEEIKVEDDIQENHRAGVEQ